MNIIFPDLHLHSSFSDGTDSPEELLVRIREAEIDCFSLCDHDTMDGCAALSHFLCDGDPAFIPGVEFSCEDKEGKYHILGYGCDADQGEFRDTVNFGHALRIRKLEERLGYLSSKYGFRFSSEDRESLLACRNPGKPHVVAMLMEKGLISSRESGFALFDGYREKVETLIPERAVRAILAAGGIPVLAHGILADGSISLSFEKTESRVMRLKSAGLEGLECFYSTFTQEQNDSMLLLAERYDLLITAGSDYHGANKEVRIGETNGADPALLEPFFAALRRKGKL